MRDRAQKSEYDRRYYLKNKEKRAQQRREYNKSPRGIYQIQKQNARRRGIPWEFTFESWSAIWMPVWDQRGKGSGKLCMARHGDTGPYSPENVKLIEHGENVAEGHRRIKS